MTDPNVGLMAHTVSTPAGRHRQLTLRRVSGSWHPSSIGGAREIDDQVESFRPSLSSIFSTLERRRLSVPRR